MTTRPGNRSITAALGAAVMATTALTQSCASVSSQPTMLKAARSDDAPRPELPAAKRTSVENELRQIAKDYPAFTRVSGRLNWAPTLCMQPPPPSVKLSTAMSGPNVTASPDASPHGRKLYFLYAGDEAGYDAMSKHGERERANGESPAAPYVNPVGQVVVKEAFVPVNAEGESEHYRKLRSAFSVSPSGLLNPEGKELERYTQDASGKLVRAGDLAGLFVMLKLDPETPGTDQGWIYATIAPDRTTITSLGVIDSCMNCHKQTDRDRLYGHKDTWPTTWPAAPTKPGAPAGDAPR